MQLHEARLGGRFSVLVTTAATLLGLFGVISVARGAEARAAEAHETMSVRQGVMTERLRDCVTFERASGEARMIVATSR